MYIVQGDAATSVSLLRGTLLPVQPASLQVTSPYSNFTIQVSSMISALAAQFDFSLSKISSLPLNAQHQLHY